VSTSVWAVRGPQPSLFCPKAPSFPQSVLSRPCHSPGNVGLQRPDALECEPSRPRPGQYTRANETENCAGYPRPVGSRAMIRTKMALSRSVSIRSSRLWHAPASALILWVCLWLNLNTGFWNIQSPSSANDWQLLVRALLPFAVLPAAGLLLLGGRRLHFPRNAPSCLLLAYGAFATLATVFSPEPLWSLY